MILVTGFNGKVGFEVAGKLKKRNIPMKCAVRDAKLAKARYGDEYEFVSLDFSRPETFDEALDHVKGIFLMYPPGKNILFDSFLRKAKEKGIEHIVYLSLKDVQFMPFIHHYKNEKLIRKHGFAFTFLRAGYFMQNLNDFLHQELKERDRIFVPAGKGKTSFVDTRDIAEVAALCFLQEGHRDKAYVITGSEALDFFEVASIMSQVLNRKIQYTNPSIKEFQSHMISTGADEAFVKVVVGVHIPTRLGLAKGITDDFEKITGRKPSSIRRYIEDYQKNWR